DRGALIPWRSRGSKRAATKTRAALGHAVKHADGGTGIRHFARNHENMFRINDLLCLVRSEGLEPPRFYSLPPQGSASTNSATSAWKTGRQLLAGAAKSTARM